MVLNMHQPCSVKTLSQPIPVGKGEDGLEVKSGSLCLLQCQNNRVIHVPVFARVYKNSYEHYAVIYRDKKFTNHSVFVNLKHCLVKTGNRADEFVIIPDNVEGTSSTFRVSSSTEVDEWLSVLQPCVLSSSPSTGNFPPSLSPVIPRSPLMPTLTEIEEEEDS